MVIEAKFKYNLIGMMETMPLEEINVTALCERCKCHRQTFYYHYQDIYDLIADIFLNTNIEPMDKTKDARKALLALISYIKGNFNFIRSTYNSAAKDLADDFIFSKINLKLYKLWSLEPAAKQKKDSLRNVTRRFSRAIADECGFWLKDKKATPERFARHMNHYVDNALSVLLPSYIELSKKEEEK